MLSVLEILGVSFPPRFRWLLLAPLLAACGSGESTGTGGSTGTGNTGGSTGTGGMASVLGTTFMGDCSMAAAWGEECTAESGFYDYCNNVACTQSPMYETTICHPPPPAPAADEFACTWLNCKKGEVCVFSEPLGDGCAKHLCMAAPAPCASTPTCACLTTQVMPPIPMSACSEDADGNATVSGAGIWWAQGG
jgi:hypothetical protein